MKFSKFIYKKEFQILILLLVISSLFFINIIINREKIFKVEKIEAAAADPCANCPFGMGCYSDWCSGGNCVPGGKYCAPEPDCYTPADCCIPNCDGKECGDNGCGGKMWKL